MSVNMAILNNGMRNTGSFPCFISLSIDSNLFAKGLLINLIPNILYTKLPASKSAFIILYNHVGNVIMAVFHDKDMTKCQ